LKIEVSNGELLDKLSIVEVKRVKIADASKVFFLDLEFDHLLENVNALGFERLDDDLYVRLKEINFELWDIEDEIRLKEEHSEFDDRFIELSRMIYIKNDERARIKKELDISTESKFREQKGHKTV